MKSRKAQEKAFSKNGKAMSRCTDRSGKKRVFLYKRKRKQKKAPLKN
jgi:hypothetical protein